MCVYRLDCISFELSSSFLLPTTLLYPATPHRIPPQRSNKLLKYPIPLLLLLHDAAALAISINSSSSAHITQSPSVQQRTAVTRPYSSRRTNNNVLFSLPAERRRRRPLHCFDFIPVSTITETNHTHTLAIYIEPSQFEREILNEMARKFEI